MGRKKKTIPYLRFDEGPLFQLVRDENTGSLSLRPVGYYRAVNGRPYKGLPSNWFSNLQGKTQLKIPDCYRPQIQFILNNYIKHRAGELAAIPWRDKQHGLVDGIEALHKAAIVLLAAIDKHSRATNYIWQRIEQVEDPLPSRDFSYDDFYPQLTNLNRRTHLLLNELRAEEARGDRLPRKGAWWSFVHDMATIYYEITGLEPTASGISRSNEDVARPSAFPSFAHSALMQIPADLRRGESGGDGNIRAFSDALCDRLAIWRDLRAFPKNGARTSRKIRRQ